ncbi:sulfatase-like hydrolase/transferase, partial [Xenorhabdus bovienii]
MFKKLAIDIIKVTFPLLIIMMNALIMLKGSGANPSVIGVFTLSILFVILSSSRKAFYFIALPIGIIYSIYTPVGLTFGKPSYEYIASLFATDILES